MLSGFNFCVSVMNLLLFGLYVNAGNEIMDRCDFVGEGVPLN